MRRIAAVLVLVLCLPGVLFARDAGTPAPRADGERVAAAAETAAETADEAEAAAPAEGEPLGFEGEDLMGRVVHKIHLDIPPTMIGSQIRRTAKLREGRTFTRSRCRKTLRSLYLRGDVADVILAAERNADGTVNVKLTVTPLFAYRDLFLYGNKRYNEDEIRRFMRFEPGSEYQETDLALFRERLRDAYRKIGNVDAKVKVEKRLDKAESKADLTVRIDEGKPYRMRDLSIQGDPGIDPDKVRRKLGWKFGRVFKMEAVQQGAQDLGKYYHSHHPLWESAAWPSQNYLEADVGDPAFTYDAKARAVDVTIPIHAGKRIDVEFDPQVFSYWERRRSLDKALGIGDQRIFNRWVVRDMAGNVKAFLQRRGYYDAQVVSEYDETAAEKKIRFSALPGREWKIERIDFVGAAAFPEKRLRGEMGDVTTYEASSFQDALTHVVRFYNTQGFLAATITGVHVTEADRKRRRLAIRVNLAEGPRTLLGKVRFEGNQVYTDAQLRALVPLHDGQPLDPFQVPGAESAILGKYTSKGYIRAQVSHDLAFNGDQTAADLVFQVAEGQQYLFGETYVRGNSLTQRHVIERELLYRSGDPYDYNLVFRSEQALARLGFFKSVKIQPVSAGFEDKEIDLVVSVVERNSGYVTAGLGYDTVQGYQGTVEIGHRNLAGHGRQVDVTVQGFVQDPRFRLDKHRAVFSFLWPWVARIPMDGNLAVTDQVVEQATFSATQFQTTLGVSTYFDRLWKYLPFTRGHEGLLTLSQFFQGALSWSREQSFVYNVDSKAVQEGTIKKGEILLAYLSPSVVRNARNDAFNPSGGSYNSIAGEWAAAFLGSTYYYVKLTGRSSWYFPFDKLIKAMPGSVFAFNISAGWAAPLAPTLEVPVTKRFFLGGFYNSLRGYDPAKVGPRGGNRNEAIGGDFMDLANVDFRLRVWNGLGLLVFADAGNVYPEVRTARWGDLRYSTGLGLYYATPVGPVGASYAFALTRSGGAAFGQVYVTIGNAF